MKPKTIIGTILICCLLAIVASFIASQFPDGLEWVAEKLDFIGKETSVVTSPMPDYEVPAVKNRYASAAIVAIVGTMAVFIVVYVVGKVVKRK